MQVCIQRVRPRNSCLNLKRFSDFNSVIKIKKVNTVTTKCKHNGNKLKITSYLVKVLHALMPRLSNSLSLKYHVQDLNLEQKFRQATCVYFANEPFGGEEGTTNENYHIFDIH